MMAARGPATAHHRDGRAPRNHRVAGFPGARPPERNTETAPGSRFPRAGGRHAVEALSAYLNPVGGPRLLQAAHIPDSSGQPYSRRPLKSDVQSPHSASTVSRSSSAFAAATAFSASATAFNAAATSAKSSWL